MLNSSDIVALFHRQFLLCNVTADEAASVFADSSSRPEYIEAAFSALRLIGARAVVVTVPTYSAALFPSQASADILAPYPQAIDALSRSSFVVDVTCSGIVHSQVRAQIQKAGARILTIIEPPETLERLASQPDMKPRVLTAARLLDRAKVIRVTSKAGTDVTFQRGTNPVGYQYGLADEPGRWDHWPSGFAAVYPEDRTAEGQIVLDSGDIVYPLNRYIHDPVMIQIRRGFIERIEGKGLDADLLRSYLEAWSNPDAFATSHVGWGVDHGAQWIASLLYSAKEHIGMDGRSFAGNFLWSTGPNKFVDRHVGCHYDIAMRRCTVMLDEQAVVNEGRLAYDEHTGESL